VRSDADDEIVILVSGEGQTYYILGWLHARGAKRPDRRDDHWWRDSWVSEEDLHPLDSLPNAVEAGTREGLTG
jgi:hypothetical protein